MANYRVYLFIISEKTPFSKVIEYSSKKYLNSF